MKTLLRVSTLLSGFTFAASGQQSVPMHLPDGTSMNYYYQNGSAVQANF
jgi:hypothetical protein